MARLCVARTNALHMMVVRFLHHADFVFESQNRFPILTVHAVHDIGTIQDFLNAIGKGIQDKGVVI